MSIFPEDTEDAEAFLKMGALGFQGGGKTFTLMMIAIGLHKMLTEFSLPGGGDTPIYFVDSERGSSWMKAICKEHGIKLRPLLTRAFVDLVPAMKEAEEQSAIILQESWTRFWRELVDSYVKARNKQFKGLDADDWTYLKGRWAEFIDYFVSCRAHCIVSGRAGYEYDTTETVDGKKELEKVGVKMKGEAEAGFEPNLLIFMERHEDPTSHPVRVWRTATVLKDRSGKLDGACFENPTFEHFAPHIECLNLGGRQTPMSERTSADSIARPDSSRVDEHREKKKVLDEINELQLKFHPSSSAADKKARADLTEKFFPKSNRSWLRLEDFPVNDLQQGYKAMRAKLEGRPWEADDAAFTQVPPPLEPVAAAANGKPRDPDDPIPF